MDDKRFDASPPGSESSLPPGTRSRADGYPLTDHGGVITLALAIGLALVPWYCSALNYEDSDENNTSVALN